MERPSGEQTTAAWNDTFQATRAGEKTAGIGFNGAFGNNPSACNRLRAMSIKLSDGCRVGVRCMDGGQAKEGWQHRCAQSVAAAIMMEIMRRCGARCPGRRSTGRSGTARATSFARNRKLPTRATPPPSTCTRDGEREAPFSPLRSAAYLQQ
jgi:hypothetical protein